MRITCDTHTHTVASGHAYSTVDEIAREAGEKKLEAVAITDHMTSMPGSPHIYHFYNLRVLPRKMYGVTVLRGAEANIMDEHGKVDVDHEVCENLDIVIASFHPPTFIYSTQEVHTQALLGAIANPLVQIIGHPEDLRYEFDIPKVVKAAADTGTVIEVNNSSLLPTSFRKGGHTQYVRILKECRKQGVSIAIGSDAHIADHVGRFSEALDLLIETSFPLELVANTSLEKLCSHLSLNLT
ncbi:MAG: phosphatase [Spirochaetia bacterium]